MSVRIIIDSTANTVPGSEGHFSVVPLTVCFGEEEYIGGVTIDHRSFYEKLIESDVLPTTSQATPEAFCRVFREVAAAGDTAVVITISSTLSGTCQSALIAAADYPGRIFVVDSRSASIGTGILAHRGLALAEEGLEAEAIAARLEQEREQIRVVALLDTLEYLKKGGRISKTAAFAGGLLSIKPVVALRDGQIVLLGKARGSRQGSNLLAQEITAAGGVDFSRPVLLGYTGLSDLLLQKYREDSRDLWAEHTDSLPLAPIGSVIGTHAGPGAIAAAFFTSAR